MSPDKGVKPVVLLLGEVVSAHAEWNALSEIAELRVRFTFDLECLLC